MARYEGAISGEVQCAPGFLLGTLDGAVILECPDRKSSEAPERSCTPMFPGQCSLQSHI